MGAGESSEIQVNFNRQNLFYFTGDQITGNIIFQNTQDKITIDSLFLECVGEYGYVKQEVHQYVDANGQRKTENRTQNVEIPFFNLRIPVVQPQYGQREIILFRGQHSWPFEFVLPQHLPPTLIPKTTSYPYVKYYTRIVLNKPWYKPNIKRIYPLTIFPRVNLCYVPGGQHPLAFTNQNRKKVHVQGTLVRGGVVPGDKLTLQIYILNPKRCEIKRIEATLRQHQHVAISHHIENIFRMDLPNIRESNNAEFNQTFDLMVPSVYLSPTFTYLLQNCDQPSGSISVNYELILDFKVRGFLSDFKVVVPVTIGTEPIPLSQQQMNVPVQMPVPSAPAIDYDEPPPSYDTICTTEKS